MTDALADEELEELRQRLLERRAALRDVLGTGDAAADTVELDQTRQGRLSRMDAMQAQAVSAETNRRRQAELRRIEAALQRLEAGEIGYCDDCGEPIAIGRLRFDPSTTRCIACAERGEGG